MSVPGAGGYHWQTQEHVGHWDQIKQSRKAERDAAFRALLDQLPQDRLAPLSIVDIGAGDGMVTSAILTEYPSATAKLVDFSDLMMAMGAERLGHFGPRFDYVLWDMNEGDWPTELPGPFDAVVSSAAIHHLTNPRKAWLTAQIYARLAPGGVFANYDLFRDPHAVFPDEEIHNRTCASLDEATGFLTAAGYCDIGPSQRGPRPERRVETALLVGRKPGRPAAVL